MEHPLFDSSMTCFLSCAEIAKLTPFAVIHPERRTSPLAFPRAVGRVPAIQFSRHKQKMTLLFGTGTRIFGKRKRKIRLLFLSFFFGFVTRWLPPVVRSISRQAPSPSRRPPPFPKSDLHLPNSKKALSLQFDVDVARLSECWRCPRACRRQ